MVLLTATSFSSEGALDPDSALARRHRSGPDLRPWTKLSLDFKASGPKIARASLRLASMWSDFPDAFAHGSPTLAASADACAEPALR